ncbi:MAG: FHIPEP family type III secretion protein, partial [Deltaproteobacteria bacterium]|nr:FHIPEP family type III secretion protein [Deltaproteobacteria bacterium]
QYNILIKGNGVAGHELMIGYLLAMDPGDAKQAVEGAIATTEPAFNLPAFWIPEDKREEAQFAGYSVVDLSTVVATHLSEVIRSHAHELLGRQEVQRLLDNLAKNNPKVVEELVPGLLPLGGVQKVLQNLLRERISIRDLLTIVETLADYAAVTKDTEILTEYVRQNLARSILRPYITPDGTLPVMTLEPRVEDMISEAIQRTEQGSFLSLDPGLAQKIIAAIKGKMEKFMEQNLQPIVLTSPAVRRHIRRLMERFAPLLVVISHNELVPDIEIRSLCMVDLNHAN